MNGSLAYFRTDLKRGFFSKKWIIGVLGVWGTFLWAGENFLSDSILGHIAIILYGVPFCITFAFCTFSYGTSICEDFENRYIFLLTIRGRLMNYIISRVIAICIYSILTMVMGMCLYIIFLKRNYPFIASEIDGVYISLLEFGAFSDLLAKGNFIQYFLAVGFQIGLLAGTLSVVAAYTSLFLKNKLIILSVPLMINLLFTYFVNNYIGDKAFLNLKYIYNATYGKVFTNELYSIFYTVLVTLLCISILTTCIYAKITRRIFNA